MGSLEAEIEVRSGAAGRKSAFIAGTRVRVSDIARHYLSIQDEVLIERIASSLPSLTKEQVQAAIVYWREHGKEIDKEINEEGALLSKIASG